MKRLIILAICSCIAAACEADFDEVKDTRQRHITFDFSTDLLFSEYLELYNDDFQVNSIEELPSDRRVCITAYCYDQCDSLIYKETQIAPLDQYQTCKIRHLDKDISYKFLFVADIVQYKSDLDYMETWFQLKTKHFDDFYLYSDQRKEDPTENIIGSAIAELVPDNQDCSIEFEPLTYNGYIILDNAVGTSIAEGYVSYTVSFKPTSMEQTYYGSLGYEFKHVSPKDSTIVMPVTLCYADDQVKVGLTLKKLDISKELKLTRANKDHRPFVAKFDCSTMTLTSYETF